MASFTKEVNARLPKRTLKINGRLADHDLTLLAIEAIGKNKFLLSYSAQRQKLSALFKKKQNACEIPDIRSDIARVIFEECEKHILSWR